MFHVRLGVFMVLAAIVAVPGCSGKGKVEPLAGPVAGADYFPLRAGAVLEFYGGTAIGDGEIDKEIQEWDVSAVEAPDGGEGFMISRRGRGILNAMEMVYGQRDEGVVTWSGMFGMAKTQFSPPALELPATIRPNARWSWTGESKGVALTMESELEGVQEVATRAGKVRCLRIRRTMGGGAMTITQWYAAGVGLVKVEMKNPGGRVELLR